LKAHRITVNEKHLRNRIDRKQQVFRRQIPHRDLMPMKDLQSVRYLREQFIAKTVGQRNLPSSQETVTVQQVLKLPSLPCHPRRFLHVQKELTGDRWHHKTIHSTSILHKLARPRSLRQQLHPV